MKQYGKIIEGKDVTNKTYVDEKDLDLDKRKLEETDFDELSNSRVLELWNQYIGEGSEESGSSGSTGSSSGGNKSNIIVSADEPTDDMGNNGNLYIRYLYTPASNTNLVDINKCASGYRLSSEGGDFTDSIHMISDYISVEAGISYDLITTEAATSSAAYVSLAWYSNSKGFISRPTGALSTYKTTINNSYTAPNGAAWARVSFPIQLKDSFTFARTIPIESMSLVFYIKCNDSWMKASL